MIWRLYPFHGYSSTPFRGAGVLLARNLTSPVPVSGSALHTFPAMLMSWYRTIRVQTFAMLVYCPLCPCTHRLRLWWTTCAHHMMTAFRLHPPGFRLCLLGFGSARQPMPAVYGLRDRPPPGDAPLHRHPEPANRSPTVFCSRIIRRLAPTMAATTASATTCAFDAATAVDTALPAR